MSDKGNHVNKTGRKGNPRMHKAVAAKLADSSLNLFEALRAGGFDYSVDDDAQALDNDQVTLGQRKNQLSRRLRLAKRMEDTASETASTGGAYGDGRKRSYAMLEDVEESELKSNKEETVAVKAKNHPGYRGPIMVRPCSGAGFRQANSAGSSLDEHPHENPQQQVPISQLSGHPIYSQIQAQAQVNPYTSFCGFPSLAALPALGGTISSTPLPSGVAVASLNSTAQRIGMTLEQLALALSHCSSLSRVLNAISADSTEQLERHEKLAQNLCLTEIKSLYSRCMLLAGFSSEQACEDSPKYIEFAVKAWELEGKRLGALLRSKNSEFASLESIMAGRGATAAAPRPASPVAVTLMAADDSDTKIPATVSGADGHSHSQSGSNCHSHSHASNNGSHCSKADDGNTNNNSNMVGYSDCCFTDGRHAHRLEGCGHKAILHQPENGSVHVDFVVGDSIECYEGLVVPPPNSNSLNMWPSQYKCEDLSCSNSLCATGMTAKYHEHTEECKTIIPKILPKASLDLDGKEWSSSVDETLLSLFKLSSDPNNNDDSSV